MKWFLVFLLFIFGCGSVVEPSVILNHSNNTGSAPFQVEFELGLNNLECDSSVLVNWNWGDGELYAHEVECKDQIIENLHIFEKIGGYEVKVSIDGLVSNIVTVSVKDKEKKFLVDYDCKGDDDCIVAGCNGEMCTSRYLDMRYSVCSVLPEAECYELVSCKCVEGSCGWDKTQQFESCVKMRKEDQS